MLPKCDLDSIWAARLLQELQQLLRAGDRLGLLKVRSHEKPARVRFNLIIIIVIIMITICIYKYIFMYLYIYIYIHIYIYICLKKKEQNRAGDQGKPSPFTLLPPLL